MRGFTRSEGVVLLALIAALVLFTATYLRTISRRERLLRSARSIQSLLISARESGVSRKEQVVVWFDLAGRRIVAWADKVPDFVRRGASQRWRSIPFRPTCSFVTFPAAKRPTVQARSVSMDISGILRWPIGSPSEATEP